MKVLYIYIIILIFLFACKKKEIYYDIPENIREASLYYTFKKGDTLKMLKNNKDTLIFTVSYINTAYNGYQRRRNERFENFKITLNEKINLYHISFIINNEQNYEGGKWILLERSGFI